MYVNEERQALRDKILAFVRENQEFTCLLQIGSGAEGFTDIYSDIDLMAGCVDAPAVERANKKLWEFFENSGTVYIDRRKWADHVLGFSAYWENGLSVDLSFMPASDMPILSKKWQLLWSKDDVLESSLKEKSDQLAPNAVVVDGSYHHAFFYLLRKAEIALCRKDYVYTEMVLNEARQKLLLVEAIIEGKKLHQFKAYHSLNHAFLASVEKTYPCSLTSVALNQAKNALLGLYVHLVEANGLCPIDNSQFKIINCFAKYDCTGE